MLSSRLAGLFLFPLLSFVCGAILALAMAPMHILPALFVGFSGFYFCLYKAESNRQAAACGFLFGFGYFLFGLSWIGNALLVEGNDFAWAWPLAICGLPAILGIFYALAAYAIRRWYRLDKLSGFLGFCALFAFTDWLRGHLFTGFPWNLFAYSWGEILEVLQVLSLGNVYYLNLLSIGWAVVPAFLFLSTNTVRCRVIVGLGLFGLLVGCYGFGAIRLKENQPEYIADHYIKMVQPNIAQHDKWVRGNMQGHYDSLLSLSSMEGADTLSPEDTTLIIWPETATSSYIMEQPRNQFLLSSVLTNYVGEAYLLSGVLKYEGAKDYSNAAALYNQNAEEIAIYKKTKLVPFGEFIPFQKWIPLTPVTRFTGFSRGDGAVVQAIPTGLKYTALICYEIIFPGVVQGKGKEKPDIIVNVTNDAWYGKSAGPYQHLLHARYRAIETGIPVIRSANTGISALFDPAGRILYKSGLFIKDSKLLQIPKTIKILGCVSLLQNLFFIFIIIGMAIGELTFRIGASNKN